jgi:hypothetical protein
MKKKRGKYETTECTEEYSVFSERTVNSLMPVQTGIQKDFYSEDFCFRRSKDFTCKNHNVDCWTTMERLIIVRAQRGGNGLSYNILIFNIFSVFSVVKF